MYIVEGTIGAGKTTFLTLLEHYIPQIKAVYEPLNTWSTENKEDSLLTQFYDDPQRWSYTLETLTMMARVQEYIKESFYHDRLRIMERSIYSGHYCFAKNGYLNGFLSEIEWSMYAAWFNFLIPHKCPSPHGFIYLRVSPEVAYERIKKRARNGETGISFEYLQAIGERHDQFLLQKNDILPELVNVPVLVLDCDEEFETNTQQLYSHINQVREFIKT